MIETKPSIVQIIADSGMIRDTIGAEEYERLGRGLGVTEPADIEDFTYRLQYIQAIHCISIIAKIYNEPDNTYKAKLENVIKQSKKLREAIAGLELAPLDAIGGFLCFRSWPNGEPRQYSLAELSSLLLLTEKAGIASLFHYKESGVKKSVGADKNVYFEVDGHIFFESPRTKGAIGYALFDGSPTFEEVLSGGCKVIGGAEAFPLKKGRGARALNVNAPLLKKIVTLYNKGLDTLLIENKAKVSVECSTFMYQLNILQKQFTGKDMTLDSYYDTDKPVGSHDRKIIDHPASFWWDKFTADVLSMIYAGNDDGTMIQYAKTLIRYLMDDRAEVEKKKSLNKKNVL
jgi:hypothetical protein